jgi:tetratricopeptide (TPR) repeat protein
MMFVQEARINALLDVWELDATENRHRLESMTRYVPTFSALRAQVFSHLRTLHSLKALDLMAIERLVTTVTDTLGNGDPNTLQAALSDFEAHYPRIGGIDKLHNDLNKYLAIDTARKGENWIQAYRLAQDNIFETPPFRERISMLLEVELPKPEFIAHYDSAMDAWRQGQLDTAFATLEGLVEQPWGEVAQRQLERNQRIKQNYADLLAAKSSVDYDDQLLEFYNELDPVQDRYFADALAEDIRQRSETALRKAEQAYSVARKDWEKYRNSGGIRGLQRLEPSVSERYRQLATILSEAYKHIRHGVKVYKLLNKQSPPEWDELNAQIANEVILQRRSLGELAMVLEPALNKAKLDLLPVPPASEPAQVDSIESSGVPSAIPR